MMKKALAIFRDAGSFVAGILVGLSIVLPVIVMTGTDPTAGQPLMVFGAPIFLALGIALQASLRPGGRHYANSQADASTF
jgi:hypothetical protein